MAKNRKKNEADFESIIEIADELPYGDEKYSLLKRALAIAEEERDFEKTWNVRVNLAACAAHSGYPQEMMVSCSWCIATFDRYPDLFDIDFLLQLISYAITFSKSFVDITRKQIEKLLDDFEDRCRRSNVPLRQVFVERAIWAIHLGDSESVRAMFEQAMQQPKGVGWDKDYENIFRIDVLLATSDEPRALKRAKDVLTRSDDNQAIAVVSSLILPAAVRRKQLGLIGQIAKVTLPIIRKNRRFLQEASIYIICASALGRMAEASRLFKSQLVNFLTVGTDYEKWSFAVAGYVLFRDLGTDGQDRVEWMLPETFEKWEKAGVYKTADLRDYFFGIAQDLVRRFDARNGTPSTSKFMAELLELRSLAPA